MDFTSSLYLGLKHPALTLKPWQRLTTGTPASLYEPPEHRKVAKKAAELVGCEAALPGSSTLHLFWDIGNVFADGRNSIFMDGGLYPIGQWGVRSALCRGVPVRKFRHFRVDELKWSLDQFIRASERPVIVTDGYCPGCGKAAPLEQYLKLAQKYNGQLVIDDTQALGILGNLPDRFNPYGFGGGGTLRYCNTDAPEVIVISSLAKGFGAPLAILCGSQDFINQFTRLSRTRVHCSPPSMADICTAERALYINEYAGDMIRERLAALVRLFRKLMAEMGLFPTGGLFPVQTIESIKGADIYALYRELWRQNIRAVLHSNETIQKARLSLIITASHSKYEIIQAAGAINRAVIKINRKESGYESITDR